MKDVFRELEMIDFDGKLSSVTWLEIFLEGWGTGETWLEFSSILIFAQMLS